MTSPYADDEMSDYAIDRTVQKMIGSSMRRMVRKRYDTTKTKGGKARVGATMYHKIVEQAFDGKDRGAIETETVEREARNIPK